VPQGFRVSGLGLAIEAFANGNLIPFPSHHPARVASLSTIEILNISIALLSIYGKFLGGYILLSL
jgi:hypothetical protein